MAPTGRRFLAAGGFVALSQALTLVFSRHADVVFPAYRGISKTLMGFLAQAASVVRFALWDIVVLVLAVVALISLFRRIMRREGILSWLSAVCLAVSMVYFVFVAGWALNHYAPSLAQEISLEVGEYTTEELADATREYLQEAVALAPQVPRDEHGGLKSQDFYELAAIAGGSYEGLAGEYPIFEGPTAPVKSLLVWGQPLLYSGHTGIFWAPTGESCVPLECADTDKPYIMCHEAAHRLAIASEQEANFAAFLACDASNDARFRYSGYYNAAGYCLNALYRYDPERTQELLQEFADGDGREGLLLFLSDRAATSAHYDSYEGAFEEVGQKVNDTYLKSFGESTGVRSYGLVVDYLIAWGRTTLQSE